MSFTKVANETVEFEHFSTASVIKLTFTNTDPMEPDEVTKTKEVWLSYSDFKDLKKAVMRVSEIEGWL